MPIVSNRRAFLTGLTAMLTPAMSRAATTVESATARIAALEARAGGRLGVAVRDTGSGAMVAHRAEERFAMCSTFKLLAAAAVLRRVETGAERLDRRIAYGPDDLTSYAPVTKAHLAEGGMSVAELCAAAIDWSDNTAANLLLRSLGGPAGLTAYARALGDSVTRLDRDEPTLNTAIPGDARDTTTPMAMLLDMQALLLGTALSESSRRQLETWLIGDKVGDKRLRAGVPASWRVGDKTGSGDNGTANTIAILRPPGRAPILATVYYTESSAPMDARNTLHKEVGAIIASAF